MGAGLLRILKLPGFQGLWERLNRISLVGMNYWGGANLLYSGELYVMGYVKNQLKSVEKPVIFDVGANLGQYVKSLETYFQTADIHCFEPSPITFGKLLLSSQNGTISSNVKIHQLGFGSESKTLKLYSKSLLSASASIYGDRLDEMSGELVVEEIEIGTIDSFCQINSVSQIDFLKIDVEGHELEVLKGATEMLRAKKLRFVQFEVTKCNLASRVFFKDFWDLLGSDFTIYRVLPQGLRKIDRYETQLEVFAEANFLAELRIK